MKTTHFFYTPFTGLGLYGGFRGNRWLRNRIKAFKQFVIPSLQAQTNKDFILWVSWRPEERTNPHVKELHQWLATTGLKYVFTYGGVCFWDDKYEDAVAHERLITALHHTMYDLIDSVGDVDQVLMTIQPSDDLYRSTMAQEIQDILTKTDMQAVGYGMGYITNYRTGQLCEYNPTTNPPFFTIKFPKEIFIEPLKHAQYTGPYKSHEYVGDKLKYLQLPIRGFMVGTHGENISTHFNHPFAGRVIENGEKDLLLAEFGIADVGTLNINTSIRKWIMRHLPYGWQRKLRFLLGECLFNRFYSFLRN